MRKIDVSCLPIIKSGTNCGKINWTESPGCILDFEYDNIIGKIEILSYVKKNQKLSVKYNNIISNIGTAELCGCKIGNVIGVYNTDFIYKIGTNIKDDKRDLTITDNQYKSVSKNNKNKRRWYRYTCNVCGWSDGWILESSLSSRKHGCACCSNIITVKNINSLNITHPHLMKYLVNVDDAFNVVYGTKKKIDVKCLDCGNTFKISTNYFTRINNVICNKCGDNISYPNKFIFNVLQQLNLEFKPEMEFLWGQNKRYDFYIPSLNCIIEAHGEQHYRDRHGWTKLSEQQNNDKIKEDNAIKNNIRNYIIIDCRKSEMEYIKNNLLNSKLKELINLSNIDWIKCEKYCTNNLIKTVCEYKRDNIDLSTFEIAKKFNLSDVTIRRYLIIGSNIWDWINYNGVDEFKNRVYKQSKIIEVFKDDISIGIFKSISDLERNSVEKFGIKLIHSNIYKSIKNDRSYNGFKFKIL